MPKRKVVKTKKIVKRKVTAKNRVVVPVSRGNIGGFPLANGVFLKGDNGLVVAMASRSGQVEVVSFKIKNIRKQYPFLFLPFLRGVTVFIENLYYYTKVLWIKRTFVKRGLKSKTRFERLALRLSQYANHIILLLVAIAFFDYLFFRIGDISTNLGDNTLYEFGTSLFFILVIIAILSAFLFDKKTESELFRYHGAEHLVLEDFQKGGKQEWGDLNKRGVGSDKCSISVVIWTTIFLAALITLLKVSEANVFLGIAVSLLFVLLSFSMSYEIMVAALGSKGRFLKNIFIKPFSWVQYLFIKAPDKKHIDVVKIALNKLKKLEGQ